MSSGEGFLGRWSRLKREGDPTVPVVPASVATDPVPADQPDAVAASMPDEPEFDISTLPSIEDLTASSDFSQFLQKGVPETLKNAALRRMWTLDPILSAPDRFAEYAWDFNDPMAMTGFGPLEPDFDPSAMLRRIMGEPDPEAVDNTGDVASEAVNVPPPNQLHSAGDEADETAATGVESDVSSGDGPGQIVAMDRARAADTAIDGSVHDENAEKEPARRRHGGALPYHE